MSDTLTAPVAATDTDGAPRAGFDPPAEVTLNRMLDDMGDRRPLAVRLMTGKHVDDPGRVEAIRDVLGRIGKLDNGWFGPRSVPPSRFLLSLVIQSLLDVAVVPLCIWCDSEGTVLFEIANYEHGDSGPHTATHTITVTETALTWTYEDEGEQSSPRTFTSPTSHQSLTWILDVAIAGKFAR